MHGLRSLHVFFTNVSRTYIYLFSYLLFLVIVYFCYYHHEDCFLYYCFYYWYYYIFCIIITLFCFHFFFLKYFFYFFLFCFLIYLKKNESRGKKTKEFWWGIKSTWDNNGMINSSRTSKHTCMPKHKSHTCTCSLDMHGHLWCFISCALGQLLSSLPRPISSSWTPMAVQER